MASTRHAQLDLAEINPNLIPIHLLKYYPLRDGKMDPFYSSVKFRVGRCYWV